MPSQQKGHKSRKATKQKKARQVRSHCEARWARRERRSRRDLEAKAAAAAAAAATVFHLFPDLPLELRELVWGECIPPRLAFHGLKFSYKIDMGVLHNQRRPPFISQVCREARDVALRHGSWINLANFELRPADCVQWPCEPVSREAWFDVRRDTLILCKTDPRPREHRSDRPAYWLDISNKDEAAIQTSGRLGFVGIDPGQGAARDDLTTEDLGPKWLQGANLDFVVEQHHLVAPLSAAVESGLFGPSGENRAIVVDLDDTETFHILTKLRTGLAYVKFPLGSGWPFLRIYGNNQPPGHVHKQMPQHGKAWWVSKMFGEQSQIAYGAKDPGLERLITDSVNSRLVALVILCPDT